MRTVLVMVVVMFTCSFLYGGEAPKPDRQKIADHLQEISVTVKAGYSQGSGMIMTRKMKVGDKERYINFIWTAGHVVAGLRKVETIIDPKTGMERKKVTFKDAAIVQEHRFDGRRVGEAKLDVKVLCYSKDQDLALLQVRMPDYKRVTMTWYLDDKTPALGTDLYHVGSMGGQTLGANSMTSGIVSQIGRVLDGQEYDQTETTATKGSSGGGVFLRDGRVIGVLTMGVNSGDNFNFVVPVRRIRKWTKKMKIIWAIDPRVKMPTEEELKKIPIEDSGATFDGKPVPPKGYKFMIYRLDQEAQNIPRVKAP